MNCLSYSAFSLYPSTQSTLYNMPHLAIHTSTFCILKCLLSDIHTPMDASETILGLVFCPRIVGMKTGARRGGTTMEQPTLHSPPELL